MERNSLVAQCTGNHKWFGVVGRLGARCSLEKDEGTWQAGPGPVHCQIKGFGLYPEPLMSQIGFEAG